MSRRGNRLGCAGLTALVLLVAAVAAGLWLIRQASTADTASNRCVAVNDGTSWELSTAQADNAALIAVTSMERGMPARAATIGLATALQESRLINIDYGDRDSIGLFQQRPSQGWGTVEQIMDPVYATGKFYEGLADVSGYTEMEVTEAAQAVQRSGFPDAYAQHEPRARAWASALTGWSTAALTCDLSPTDGPGSPETFGQRVQRDFGSAVVATVDGTGDGSRMLLSTDALTTASGGDPARSGWAVAQWAVAVAADQQVVDVQVGDQLWDREADGWVTAAAPVADGTVAVTLAGQRSETSR
ncbi:hypothetical protein [Cellulomonas taurus]|uniref:hypothetical protein n=1 Tax=Cellulomonas taurus TaxID=2729175 RepID=UPI00145E58C0|nr:hypothetical protein [Cellulomonas taurus]